MKELRIIITLYDSIEISDKKIAHIRNYLEQKFPTNKGIGHNIETEIPDYKEIMDFMADYYKKLE